MSLGRRLTLESTNIALAEEDLANQPGGRLGDFVRIRVGDTGQGMVPEVRARLFEPYFTTKRPGNEVGHGLAFVYTVVKQHHGWIECFSNVGRGTRFDLFFPRFGLDTSGEPSPATQSRPRGISPRILLAEANAMVRDFGRLILEEEGCQVLAAEDGVPAIEIF
jgi:CheY-like chemotaxis protein